MTDKDYTGIIFNIQKYSVHDGPGIRTLVFLKGCPLRCLWCCNPESQQIQPEPGYHVGRCFRCGRCVEACSQKALSLTPLGVNIDRSACSGDCPVCFHVCPDKALTIYGEQKSVAETLRVVEQDALFYSRSGGGLTLSGGEPFMQPEFTLAMARESSKRRIPVAIETCAQANTEDMLNTMPYVKYLLLDVKHLDPDVHKHVTGVSNERILTNIRAIRRDFPDLQMKIRTPVIPGINDCADLIHDIALFAASVQAEYELLPYHRMGISKYASLHREYFLNDGILDERHFHFLQEQAKL